jgi:hypothetical protein
VIFFGIAIYVLVVFFFIVDVLRQRALSGAAKAVIVVALILFPVIGILGYGLWRMRQSRGLPSV